MARRPSFSCAWTEPFLGLTRSPAGAVWHTIDGEAPLTRLGVSTSGRVLVVRGTTAEKARLTVRIAEKEGSDGMSEFTTAHEGVIVGSNQSGSCIRHGDGTVPKRVVRVPRVRVSDGWVRATYIRR
jgi:hypothetical protein